MNEMKITGNSSLWCEKYRPITTSDLILPNSIKSLFSKFVEDKDIPNMIFVGKAGLGKTASAYSICNDLQADYLYINASLNGDIETIRTNVTNFSTTYSLLGDNKKVIILDEMGNIGNGGNAASQDALKSLIETTESNCRFIFTTNNYNKIIDPIKSRCQTIDFNLSSTDLKSSMICFFKRVQWILSNENITFDKKVLANFIQNYFPDMRKCLNELQKFVSMYGIVNEDLLFKSCENKLDLLISEMKTKKWNNCRKLVAELDWNSFYSDIFYALEDHIVDQCKPNILLITGDWGWKSGLSFDKEHAVNCCVTELMKEIQWK